MNSDSTLALTGGRRRRDRLSKLSDATLGHILSFLPADEAARAALLSRRWRHVFAHVHTVSLDEPEPDSDNDDGVRGCYGACRSCGAKDRAAAFANRVSAALLGRGTAGAPVPLRALRVGFDAFSPRPNAALVDVWLWHAVRQARAAHGGGELHLDLRLRRDQYHVCDRRYALCRERFPPVDANDTAMAAPLAADYAAPRSVLTCAALRTLRLGYCRLDLADSASAVVALPSLETLHLTGVAGGERAVQRLLSACGPRLAALTLEAYAGVTALSVPRKARLRTLALRCCHDLRSVDVADASELRAFEYRGAVPASSWFLTLHTGGGPVRISSSTLDFCGKEAYLDPFRLDGLEGMLQLFVGVERLHLTSARLGCGVASLSPSAFPDCFTKLRHLELTGMLPEDDATAIDAVIRILERTPNLETLSLFFMPEPEPEAENKLLHGHELKYDKCASLDVPDVELPCLRERVKEINFVHYQGGIVQRTLAKFLLCNAPAVQEVCGEFASGPLFVQIKLMEEIKGWVMNKSANMIFF